MDHANNQIHLKLKTYNNYHSISCERLNYLSGEIDFIFASFSNLSMQIILKLFEFYACYEKIRKQTNTSLCMMCYMTQATEKFNESQ